MRERGLQAAFVFAVAALFVERLSLMTQFDPDGFHQMALFRHWLRSGSFPLGDPFAFTRTVYPVVHHEWGAGAILYGVATSLGAPGIMAVRWLLSIAVVVVAAIVAVRRAPVMLVVFCAPLALILGQTGFTTIRASLYSMLFLAIVLLLIDLDRQDARKSRFLLGYLLLLAVWINVHAGWVVGVGAVGLHAIEQLLRRRPARHLIVAIAATPLLMLATPYGRLYPMGWWHSITQPRDLVPEWQPLIESGFVPGLVAYGMAVLLVIYAVVRRGPRALPGLLFVAVGAIAAWRHQRHAMLFAVIWFCAMPGYLASTPMASLFEGLTARRRLMTGLTLAAAAAGIAVLAAALPNRPFSLRLPAQAKDVGKGEAVYPMGAVDHLDRVGFRGKLVTPFDSGGFVSWRLHPRVLVSLDGRYEAAYAKGVLEDNLTLFGAKPGWKHILSTFAPDAILLERDAELSSALGREGLMVRIYDDDVFQIWARPALGLAPLSRRGQPIPTSFP